MTPVARMQPFERRRLSGAEIALGQSLFAAEIDWPRIGVAQAPVIGFAAMVPLGRTIVFGRWRAARDFADAELAEQGWFIHELAHVWQAARGVILAAAKLAALGQASYRYTPCPDARLEIYNIESQAEILRHLFLARAGAGAPDAPSRQWLEEIWAKR
jgi:hypothetical protein